MRGTLHAVEQEGITPDLMTIAKGLGGGYQPIGAVLVALPDRVQVMAVGLKSPAAKAGFEQGFDVTGIEVERSRPASEWLFVPALLLLAGIMWRQDRRRRPRAKTQSQPAVS